MLHHLLFLACDRLVKQTQKKVSINGNTTERMEVRIFSKPHEWQIELLPIPNNLQDNVYKNIFFSF